MSQKKSVKLIEIESRTAADWKPIINGFNVIFNLSLSTMLTEGLNPDDADDVACCAQIFKFLEKDVLTELLRKEVCNEN
jgi:hypothetical protein